EAHSWEIDRGKTKHCGCSDPSLSSQEKNSISSGIILKENGLVLFQTGGGLKNNTFFQIAFLMHQKAPEIFKDKVDLEIQMEVEYIAIFKLPK
ncbi:hypothetical protein E2320_004745, partial [Naja naja]